MAKRRTASIQAARYWFECAEHPMAKSIIATRLAGAELSADENTFLQQRRKVIRHAIAALGIKLTVARIGPGFQVIPSRSGISIPPKLRRAFALLRDAPATPPPIIVPAKPTASYVGSSRTPSQTEIDAFYASWEWARLRYRAVQKAGRACMCCGATPADGARIVVDHIKPIRRYWHLRLDPENLQVLCDPCNKGKGSWDETDFRSEPEVTYNWRPGDEEPPPWVN